MKIDALKTSDILTHQTHAFLFAGSFQKAINDNVKDKPCSLIKGELKAKIKLFFCLKAWATNIKAYNFFPF